jgi:lipoprotein-anchoring transpeptidase ErfK/SrfK
MAFKIFDAAIIAGVALALSGSSQAGAEKIRLFGPRPAKPVAARPVLGQPQPVHYQWTLGAAPKAHSDFVAAFGKPGLNPGQYVWSSATPATGDSRVVIDLLTQMTYVYRGDTLVGAAHVSTARQGHITPMGEWTILEKRPFYRSKKYDNAPMPWMQRIDDYGVAMHGGPNPGYPASHGCIRLPMKFAEKLYGVTKVGTKVVIEG